MSRTIRVATGNAAKMEMLGRFLAAADLTPVMADPGDAEDLAPVGYESAVLAKLAGVVAGDPGDHSPVVAHDCGFEFECLGGAPGADTKKWLAEVGPGISGVLTPNTAVRVVHWAALGLGSEIHTFYEIDLRTVPERWAVTHHPGLPLTDRFHGPSDGLQRLMTRVAAKIRTEAEEGP
ncbi:MAG: hypothetical protein AUG49_07230 [Catenulispora sp. 13_1_20CM_3_70_7]|jgi:hypothetical protein|nr:MAG: hypothetical protein AUG49_07230 [Catenulispora sp. 13_1_20CM_3_70_7]